MKKALFLVLSVVFGLALVGCDTTQSPQESQAAEAVAMDTVKGTLAYRERIALPDNAVVTVTLEDISKMDVASETITEQTFTTDGKQVPFDFELSYDTNKVQQGNTYSVRATIKVDDKLRFTTDTIHWVITDLDKTKEVDLRLISVR